MVDVPGTIGPYRVQTLLGEGGMAHVYRAVHRDTGRIVALKVMKSDGVGDHRCARRFHREVRAAGEVEHRHLVDLLDFGEWQGRRYLAMRFVDGHSLEQRISAEGPLPIGDVIRVAAQIGSALDALHAVGLVHRDVKAANILLAADGAANLSDFGLAKGPTFSALTRPRQIVGTLDYLAPERIRGKPASAATDIYALGCVVYKALCGRTPFGGRSLFEVGAAILCGDPPDPLADRACVPRQLSTAALLALAKNPAQRPPTATAYARLLSVATR